MKKIILCIAFFLIQAKAICGFSSLKLGVDARSGGLGMAYTALSTDGSAGYWNPAGLAAISGQDLILSHLRWIQDVNSSFVGFGWSKGKSGFGCHILYTEIPGIEQRTVPSPEPLSIFSAYELAAGLSYGRQIRPNMRMGLTLKFLYEKIYIEEAVGFAGDLGLQWDVTDFGLRLGAVIQNIGKSNKLRDESIPLPLLGKIGASIPLSGLGGQWIFATDAVYEKGDIFHLFGGCEYVWRQVFSFRLGYQTGYDSRNITGGIGFVWKKYRLDYHFMPLTGGLGDSHQLSVGLTF
jgi:hypothetical protein